MQEVPDIRAFVPVPGDPLEVEVDGRPEHIGYPRTIILLGSKKPLGILDQNQCTERRAVYRLGADALRYWDEVKFE